MNIVQLQALSLGGGNLLTHEGSEVPVRHVFSQQALREAEEDLQVTQKILDEAKDRLREVEDGIATLQAKYRGCIAKKEELEMKCELCEQRLGRADKVRDGAKF